MFDKIIEEQKNQWLHSSDCGIKSIIDYIKEKKYLRLAQIEAIETYLFLKLYYDNKPISKLFSNGDFIKIKNLDELNINQNTRQLLQRNKSVYALFDYLETNNLKSNKLYANILEGKTINFEDIINEIFYNAHYTDYLFSLPMGAGKTFLMACFIYIDLYFSKIFPDNKNFAHNFLVLIPSGLKNSITPSLRNIQNFDPAWIFPEPIASQLKHELKFEILDEAKNGKKSFNSRDPNTNKVNNSLQNPFGNVFVVNAEKVILEKLFDKNNQLFDSKELPENDLKNTIGKIPNLSIIIDEVHHAQTDDIRLRAIVNYWQKQKNIISVLGFSGTPYLNKPDKMKSGLEFKQITNTIYYYPLKRAIDIFLKKPIVKHGIGLSRNEILQNGINDFLEYYGNKQYENSIIAKCAIYCPSIKVLEEEIYTILTNQCNINPSEILKYHRGDKEYSCPAENESQFELLDSPLSNKKFILLVGIGKEGWDCRSLTSVILSQKGSCSENMVLQVSCRCLRQIGDDNKQTALIWLSKDNYDTLDKQLKHEQNTSIKEIQALAIKNENSKPQIPRMNHLKLPKINFNQLKIIYNEWVIDSQPIMQKLNEYFDNLPKIYSHEIITIKNFETTNETIESKKSETTQIADYANWLYGIYRDGFATIQYSEFLQYHELFKKIFDLITNESADNIRYFQTTTDNINQALRQCFYEIYECNISKEWIPATADLCIVNALGEYDKNDKHIFPTHSQVETIIDADISGIMPIEYNDNELKIKYNELSEHLTNSGMKKFIPTFDNFILDLQSQVADVVKYKDSYGHYLPYIFRQSLFERELLTKTLKLQDFRDKNLEIYYNGERHLTEFSIKCVHNNKNLGVYTPDFLIMSRDDNNNIAKVLIVETKGAGFATDFIPKRQFMEKDFIPAQNGKFEFLYIQESDNITALLSAKINEFF